MSNYTVTTNFGAKDPLPSGDPAKVVKGAEFTTEFNNIATAIATKADLASPVFTGDPTAPTPADGDNDTSLATTAFIRRLLMAGTDIASASTITPPAYANSFTVTGTIGITAISSSNSWDGREILLRFAGALTLTHSATLNLFGANITTAAGDFARFRQRTSGTWDLVSYQRASGAVFGDGSALTNLNASNLASGTVPDARFPSVLPAVSGANLTNLNAGALASGTVPSARMSGAYTGITAVATVLSQNDLGVSGAAGSNRGFRWTTNGTLRWYLGTDTATESGSNAGSNIALYRYDDSGNYLSYVFSADRATGRVTFGTPTSGNTINVNSLAGQYPLYFNNGTVTGGIYADTSAAWIGTASAHNLLLMAGNSYKWVISASASTRAIVGVLTDPITVAFSATPTFNAASSNVFEFGALTANVTSMTISNQTAGQTIQIRFVQDATGGRTVALPTGAVVSGSLDTGANKVTWLVMTYSGMASRWEGTWTRIG